MRPIAPALILFVLFGLLAAAPATVSAAPPTMGGCPIFPADHVWNTPIDTLPRDPNSTTFVNTIGASIGLKADFGSGLWDGGPIGIPFIKVPGTQTKYPATFYYPSESDPGPYAIPLNAPIEGGPNATGDRHAISVDTDNCILYELFDAHPGANGWSAGSGAIFDLRGYALRPAGWTSADAAGLAMLPGLVRFEDILAGEIAHAIRFTVPQTRNTYIWPARHKASSLTGTQYPPMGQRFRLRADFDISTFSATNQVILKALKKYGMILSDNGSAWYMSGVPDERWNNSDLNKLRTVLGSNLEAIDQSSLMIDPNSGKARQSGTVPVVTVTVSPSTANVATGATQQLTATVNGSSNATVTWSVNGVAGGNVTVGTVSATGLYTAPASVPSPATVTLRATSAASPTAFADSSITVKAPVSAVSVSVTPTTADVNTGATRQLTAAVTGSSNTGVTWSVNGVAGGNTTVGTVSASGLYTAPATVPSPATVKVRATSVASPASFAEASVTIKAPPSVTVTVSPTSASVRLRNTRQFTATVTNATNRSVTWSVNGVAGGNSTVGTISSSGVYRAPSRLPASNTVIITATSVQSPTVKGTATVTLRR